MERNNCPSLVYWIIYPFPVFIMSVVEFPGKQTEKRSPRRRFNGDCSRGHLWESEGGEIGTGQKEMQVQQRPQLITQVALKLGWRFTVVLHKATALGFCTLDGFLWQRAALGKGLSCEPSAGNTPSAAEGTRALILMGDLGGTHSIHYMACVMYPLSNFISSLFFWTLS